MNCVIPIQIPPKENSKKKGDDKGEGEKGQLKIVRGYPSEAGRSLSKSQKAERKKKKKKITHTPNSFISTIRSLYKF
ncbi:hypothetical protein BO71DRAFT_160135 [Aspergillus ellipticus CBS 707.79]|uniref:Uncharacterized protein n=1 Tax=Aspergillus ellipticus CBS 707.79 TaxID=1448320 RepID=A0A319DRS8_9EURO|nr:hypothetical protein BO71DRAFT_160135 [Aspergillus ellipticus CBS 707.79]